VDGQFEQLLRMRVGVPTVPVDAQAHEWMCHCSAARLQRQREKARFDRTLVQLLVAEHRQYGTRLRDEPFHGLCCSMCQGNIINRHDNIRDLIIKILRRWGKRNIDVRAEPSVPRDGRHLRADIAVTFNSVITYVDVGITCPATRAQVRGGSHKEPGKALEKSEKVKLQKYDHLKPNFVPFILETGGRLNERARTFVEELASKCGVGAAGARVLYQQVSDRLALDQIRMMAYKLAGIRQHRSQRQRDADDAADERARS